MKRYFKYAVVALLLFTAFLQEQVDAASQFNDVKTGHWALQAIQELHRQGIINGYPDGRFGPDNRITRQDAAVMLVRALKLDTKGRSNPHFKDVNQSLYAYDAIAAAADEGLFKGNKGFFRPGQSLTRAELAVVLANAYHLQPVKPYKNFKDVSSTFWGYDNIQALVSNKITVGYPDLTFKPNQPVTRAEFSVFLSRTLDQAGKTSESGAVQLEVKEIE